MNRGIVSVVGAPANGGIAKGNKVTKTEKDTQIGYHFYDNVASSKW